MKALSIWQPWASAIAFGVKSIETRGWTTKYRGPIAIHAARRWTRAQEETFKSSHLSRLIHDRQGLPLGAVIAVGRLVDCRPVDQLILAAGEDRWGDYTAGRFGWTLTHVRALAEPIPYRGRQGLFEIDDFYLPRDFR